MKLQIYSDLHLEFDNPFKRKIEGDILVLAGDITTFNEKGFKRLENFLEGCSVPVIYIAGNHEYYTKRDLEKCKKKFIENFAHRLIFLDDEYFGFGNVNFFGGTMWTNFNHSPLAILEAKMKMNDFNMIYNGIRKIRPEKTMEMHQEYKNNLVEWLKVIKGKKVVISHHAPVRHSKEIRQPSLIDAAYISLDMVEIIEEFQPDLWIFGHTHQSEDMMIGKTRIVSNPFGYRGFMENIFFDPKGLMIEV